MTRRAFTLIELLIVVAIIAILAAIAIPNFLEAQTRSKVARAKSDMRTVASAVEAYAIDNNTIPFDADDYPDYNQMDPASQSRWNQKERFALLTTPLPYLSSMPADPFQLAGTVQDPMTQLLFPGDPPQPYAYLTAENSDPRLPKVKPQTYGITSVGPNRIFDSAQYDYALSMEENQMNSNYDPSNGTISRGDIIRSKLGKGGN
jgi:prepilin-type N-terminal cleavage/methylation domain-containing protein